MDIYKVIGLSLVAAILITLVREYKPELAIPISISAGCVIILTVFNEFTPLINDLKSLINESSINYEYFKIMLKALGICYITQFACDVCNDFGHTSLSSKIELCGRITLAALSLPLVSAIIKIVKEMI